MSANNRSTSQNRALSELLESDDEFLDAQHYTSNYTRQRPPHLNPRNFPSSGSPFQGGPMTDSSNAANDGLATRQGEVYDPQHRRRRRYASSSSRSAAGSSTTAATVKLRSEAVYYASMEYGAASAAAAQQQQQQQPLTEEAVQILNHFNRAGAHGGGDIREWINRDMASAWGVNGGGGGGGGDDASVVVLRSRSGPHSRATIASSRSIVSSAHRDRTVMDEAVFAAGEQFADISRPMTLIIGGEDVA